MNFLKLDHFKTSLSMKMELIKVKEVRLVNMSYNIIVVRDRSRAICQLLSDPTKLQEEREFAK